MLINYFESFSGTSIFSISNAYQLSPTNLSGRFLIAAAVVFIVIEVIYRDLEKKRIKE